MAKKRKKPENWYAFSQIDCDLYKGGMSNMIPRSRQHYCKRKDRRGKVRPYWEGDEYYDLLKCCWTVCPKIPLTEAEE